MFRLFPFVYLGTSTEPQQKCYYFVLLHHHVNFVRARDLSPLLSWGGEVVQNWTETVTIEEIPSIEWAVAMVKLLPENKGI